LQRPLALNAPQVVNGRLPIGFRRWLVGFNHLYEFVGLIESTAVHAIENLSLRDAAAFIGRRLYSPNLYSPN
jgi:hypothetical protein